jgi:hypothetical protein
MNKSVKEPNAIPAIGSLLFFFEYKPALIPLKQVPPHIIAGINKAIEKTPITKPPTLAINRTPQTRLKAKANIEVKNETSANSLYLLFLISFVAIFCGRLSVQFSFDLH